MQFEMDTIWRLQKNSLYMQREVYFFIIFQIFMLPVFQYMASVVAAAGGPNKPGTNEN